MRGLGGANSLRHLRYAMETQTALWISTRRMAELLGVHRVTLQRMKSGGYFKAGHHFRKANPLSARSNTLWNSQRVLLRIDTP